MLISLLFTACCNHFRPRIPTKRKRKRLRISLLQPRLNKTQKLKFGKAKSIRFALTLDGGQRLNLLKAPTPTPKVGTATALLSRLGLLLPKALSCPKTVPVVPAKTILPLLATSLLRAPLIGTRSVFPNSLGLRVWLKLCNFQPLTQGAEALTEIGDLWQAYADPGPLTLILTGSAKRPLQHNVRLSLGRGQQRLRAESVGRPSPT